MTDSGQRVVTYRGAKAPPDAGGEPAVTSSPRPVLVVSRALRPLDRLQLTIEAEVIPRLLLARAVSCPSVPAVAAATSEDVRELTELVLATDQSRAFAFIAKLRQDGDQVERLYLDLLAPVARRLGVLWEEDLCDFTQVTLGVCCLQQAMRELGSSRSHELGQVGHGRRILLTPVPGEQHSFGLFMVAEFFRHEGWDVWSGPAGSAAHLAQIVHDEWFAVVGISTSAEVRLDATAGAIRAVRRASRNRRIGVMVGGQLFTQRPELAGLVGADATAPDGRTASLHARQLVSLLLAQA